MYNTFYGLKENPFDITPDSKFLFWSQKHQTAFRHLLYSVQSRKGLVLLTGEVGTGKTTLLNALVGFFKPPEAKTRTVYLVNSKFTAEDLFRYIFSELGLKTRTHRKSDYWIKLKNFLLACSDEGEKTLLILDESQNYSLDVLEEVRLLSNLETSEGKLIQIILAGQPQLMRNISSPQLYQLKQRIGISYNLQPLNREETKLYIRKRLNVAGAIDESIFSDTAIEAAHDYSEGIPRIINILCDNALLFGYATKCKQVDERIIEQVAENMEIGRLHKDSECLDQNDSHFANNKNTEDVENEAVEKADDEIEKADKIVIEHAKNYVKSKLDIARSEEEDYRQVYENDGRIERKEDSGKRFVWLAQVAIISTIILGTILFAKSTFFERFENFIQATFRNASHDASPSVDNDNNDIEGNNKSAEASRREDEHKEGNLQEQIPIDGSGNGQRINERTLATSQANYRTQISEENINNGDNNNDNGTQSVSIKKEMINEQIVAVSSGDTFRDILLRKYGEYNKTVIGLVLDANPEIRDINTILIGQRILLPYR